MIEWLTHTHTQSPELIFFANSQEAESSFIPFFFNHIVLDSFFFLFLASLCGMWDLSSLTKDQTLTPCIGSMRP